MIIGLAGAKESGKNTAAKFIIEAYGNETDGGYIAQEHSFAAKLKQSAIACITGTVVPVEEAIEWSDKIKETGLFQVRIDGSLQAQFTGRQYLQWYGTEAHRDIFGADFWIEAVMKDIPKAHEIQPTVGWDERLDLITDVRFPNEAEAIRNAGGWVVRIVRPDVENSGDGHASEKPLPDDLIDFFVYNDKDLNHFRNEVLDVMLYGVKLNG